MITLEQAKERFSDIVADCGEAIRILKVWEIQFSEPIYVVLCIDSNGKKIYPGERFPSIRKSDGVLVDWQEPCPT